MVIRVVIWTSRYKTRYVSSTYKPRSAIGRYSVANILMCIELHPLLPREVAIDRGLSFYFDGRPCNKGMIGKRRTKSYKCVCELCSAKDRANRRRRFNSNIEAERANNLARYYRNKESYRARYVASRPLMTDERRSELRMYNREYKRARRKTKPEIRRYEEAKRRALKKTRMPNWFGEFDQLVLSEAAKLAVMRERTTGIEWHVDHMIPLAAEEACGLHCAANIQVIPARFNIDKGNKLELIKIGEWLSLV